MTKGRGAAVRFRLWLLGAALLLPAEVARADAVARWRPYAAEASARFGVPIAWIEQVMRLESGGRTRLGGRPITSRAGAMGLMQLMPGTWAEMRDECGLGLDPHDPRDNILAGTAYLRRMYDRFGYPGLFGAYNAGPARYAAYLAGRGLPGETRAYLAALAGPASTPLVPQTSPARAILFVFHADGVPAPAQFRPPELALEPRASDSLFVVRPR